MTVSDQKLESYKEGNLYARSIHDSLYKLAGLSFTFNTLLLAGLSFVVKNRNIEDGLYTDIFPFFVCAIGLLGIVFNFGALFSYRDIWKSWAQVHFMLRDYENSFSESEILLVQSTVVPRVIVRERITRGWVYTLTHVFFGLLLIGWFASFRIVFIANN